MKRFRFKLEAVHKLRLRQRDEAERELARATAVAAAAEKTIEEIEGRRSEIETRLAGLIGEIDALEAAWQSNYLIVLAEREGEARANLSRLERERETHREHLVATTRQAEVTEQLRERQQARHDAAVARAEQIQMDEIAILATQRGGANPE